MTMKDYRFTIKGQFGTEINIPPQLLIGCLSGLFVIFLIKALRGI
jgi:hypothetical protein